MVHKVGTAAWMTTCQVFHGILSFIPHILIAYHLGLTSYTDAYFMASGMILSCVGIFRISTFQKIYMSIFPQYTSNLEKLSSLYSSFLLKGSLFMILIMGVLLLGASQLVHIFAPGFSFISMDLTLKMFCLLIPSLFYFFLTGIFLAVLHTYDQFMKPAIVQLLPVGCVAFASILWLKTYGIYVLIFATLLGYLLNLLLLWWLVHSCGIRLKLKNNSERQDLLHFLKMLFPFYAGGIAEHFTQLGQNILTSFLPAGSVSILSYVRKFRRTIIDYILSPVPTILHPILTRQISINDEEHLYRTLRQTLQYTNYIFLPFIFLFSILSPLLVNLLFNHGAIFTDQLNTLSLILSWVALGLFFANMNSIFARTLIAYRKTGILNFAKVGSHVLVLGLSFIFFQWCGLMGLGIALACVTPFEFLFISMALQRYLNIYSLVLSREFIKIVTLNFLIAGSMGVFIILYLSWILSLQTIFQGVYMGIIVVLYFGIYFVSSWILGFNEFKFIKSMVLLWSPQKEAL